MNPFGRSIAAFCLWVNGGFSAPFSPSETEAASGSHDPVVQLDPVAVTGTRLEDFDAHLFTRIEITAADLLRSGSATPGDWLQRLPFNSGGVNSFASNPTSDASARQSVNFRGLGGSATLVLINGRRVAPMGLADGSALPFDVGALPLGALESIEVLLDGAAAIYGADAVGGVVNFRPRRDWNGGQARMALRQFEDTDWSRREFSLAQGLSSGRVSLIVALDHAANNDVRFGDRPISRTEDLRRYGGANYRSGFAFPAFVQLPPDPALPPALAGRLVGLGSVSGAGVVTLSGPTRTPLAGAFVAIPPSTLADGTPRPGDSAAAFDRASHTSLIPAEETTGVWISGRTRLNDATTAFADFGWRRRVLDGAIHPTPVSLANEGGPGLGDGPGGVVILPATSPYNPFGIDLRDAQFSLTELGDRHRVFTNEVPRVVAGLEGAANVDTRWETAVLWTRNRVVEDMRNVITDAALQDGLSGRLGGYINPFGPSDPGVIDRARTTLRNTQDFTLRQWDARVQHAFTTADDGPDLLAGAGAEWRDEAFRARPTALAEARGYVGWGVPATTTVGRETLAGHAELGMKPWRGWSAHVATRAEQNEDYGVAWTPQAGASFELAPGLRLRARWAELFRPPDLLVAYGGRISYTTTVTADPARPDLGIYDVRYTEGGNTSLDPERTTSWRFGAEWTTTRRARTAWSADFWRYEQRDLIARIGAQNLIEVEAASPDTFADRIVRAPAEPDGRPGRILRIDDSFINIDRASSQGWDFSARADWTDQAGGAWRAESLTTYLMSSRYEDPIGGSRQLAGGPGRPRWRGTASLTREWSAWDAGASWQWIGHQEGNGYAADGDTSAAFRVFTNLSLGWRPAPALRIGFLVTNLFDVDPPVAYGSSRGFDPGLFDNRGRGYAITADYAW